MRVGDPMRGDILNRANGKCEYCHYPEHFSPSAFEVEHIILKSANGLTRIENLALACSHCNAYVKPKGNWMISKLPFPTKSN